MELVVIKTDSNEWDYMWNWLENHPLNKGLEDPTTATNGTESWMYMGSYKQKDKILHCLRHRNHPITNSIQTIYVKNSDGFTPEQIHNEIKL